MKIPKPKLQIPNKSQTANLRERGNIQSTPCPSAYLGSLCGLCAKSLFLLLLICLSLTAFGQDNYEIQVYASETVPAGRTIVELHSNYTIDGQRERINGV